MAWKQIAEIGTVQLLFVQPGKNHAPAIGKTAACPLKCSCSCARASRLLDLQRQQALARAEDEEVRLPGLGSYGYVVPDQAVVRQQALELVQHQHPALAGVAAPLVNLGQTLWKTAIFLPRCSIRGCVSGVQQVIALGAPRRLALRMRAESAAGLSNQKGYFKKAISARWTSAFSHEKMSNRCLGPMGALPRAHSSGQGLGWLEPEEGHARAKAVCLPLRPTLGLLQKRKCLPPASEAMRAVFAWAVLGLLRPCAAQWLWHVRAGAACGKWIHAPERLCTSCRRACTVSWYSERVFHLFGGKRHGNYCRSGAKRQPARS